MIYGTFFEGAYWLKVNLFWNNNIKPFYFIVDTGFTGELQIPLPVALELGLPVIGVDKVKIANGDIINVPIANVVTNLEGKTIVTNAIISKGQPLLGLKFLKDMGVTVALNPVNNIMILNRISA